MSKLLIRYSGLEIIAKHHYNSIFTEDFNYYPYSRISISDMGLMDGSNNFNVEFVLEFSMYEGQFSNNKDTKSLRNSVKIIANIHEKVTYGLELLSMEIVIDPFETITIDFSKES